MNYIDFTDEKHDRQVLLPSPEKFAPLYDFYKQQEKQIWSVHELDFSKDIQDWRTSSVLTDEVKQFILHVIGFFAVSDQLVITNLIDSFIGEVRVPECKAFFAVQAFIEVVHSETYAIMLNTFSEDGSREEIVASPSIQGKAKWAQKYMNNDMPFNVRLWAFCVFEGVLFQASFASMFWLKKKNVCPGITSSNDLISKDERLHALFGAAMLNMAEPLALETLNEVLTEAVRCEEEFVREALPNNLMGMNQELLIQYVHFSADRILNEIDHSDKGKPEPLYNAANPFTWMQNSDLDGKTNFFERRVTDYERDHSASVASGDALDLVEDF